MDKLPMELFYMLAPSLNSFELLSLLTVCPYRGSFRQLRKKPGTSHQDRLVWLIEALRVGRLDLVQQVPELPQLLQAFDGFAEFSNVPDENEFFGGNEPLAKSVAEKSLGGYINPLIVAITRPSRSLKKDIVQYLLDNGASPNMVDKFYRRSPLYAATESKAHDAVSLLLQYNACQNISSRVGESLRLPLDAAVEQNDPGLVELLLDHDGYMKTRPFHGGALKQREKSSLVILDMLVERRGYHLTEEESLNVFKRMCPRLNLPSRRSARFQRKRSARVLTTRSARELTRRMKKESFVSIVKDLLRPDTDLQIYTQEIFELE